MECSLAMHYYTKIHTYRQKKLYNKETDKILQYIFAVANLKKHNVQYYLHTVSVI